MARLGSSFKNGVLFGFSQWNVELSNTSKSKDVGSSYECFDEDESEDCEEMVRIDWSFDE